MNKVRDLITHQKNLNFCTISPFANVKEAIVKMEKYNLGALIVLDNDQVVGVFSERDFTRHMIRGGVAYLSKPLHETMESNVVYVTPDYDLKDCLALMNFKQIRNLPVLEDGKLVGFVNLNQISAKLIEGKEFEISSLLQYISGVPSYEYVAKKSPSFLELIWHKPFKNPFKNRSYV